MKNIISVLFIFFISIASYSQDKVVAKSFVKKDTIVLRFGPSSPSLLRAGLVNGYQLERYENNIENIGSKKVIVIPPSIEIIDNYKIGTVKEQQVFAMIDGFLNSKDLDEKSEKFIFAMLLLSSSVDSDYMNGLSLVYKDTEFDHKKKYVYKVSINDQENLAEPAIISVNPKKIDKNIDFESLEFEARIKREEVYLKWNASELEQNYAGYWIEKSLDGINFEQINETPYQFFKSQYEQEKTHADFLDTSVVEGSTYYYRIRGINHIAEKGGYSNVVKVYIRKSLKGEVRIDSIYAHKFDRIISGKYLSFEAKDDNQLSKFIIFRSDSMSFGYTPLKVSNSKIGSEFEFNVPSPIETGDRYYYKVAAISEDDDTVFSFHTYFFTLDQIAPEMPTGLKGTIDEKGVVSLEWNENPDNDIRGYRVFWANSLKEEFIESTTHFAEETIYSDTLPLNTLTSEIYYSIRAVDLNYNNSEQCKPIKLTKPDTIPPVSCVIKTYKVGLNGVYLKWNNSTSKDVVNNILLREDNKTHIVDTLMHWSDTTSFYQDSTGYPGNTYIYTIETADKKPNKSLTEPVFVNYETGTRSPVQDLVSEVDREGKQIKLTWAQDLEDVYSIKIYRSKNDGNFILFKTMTKVELNEFVDSQLNINNVYHYKFKVVYNSGINSEFSEVIDVMY